MARIYSNSKEKFLGRIANVVAHEDGKNDLLMICKWMNQANRQSTVAPFTGKPPADKPLIKTYFVLDRA